MMHKINRFVLSHIKAIEMVSVLTRISCFGLLSWMGPDSPFGWVWALNTLDAIALTWCSLLKKDAAYTLLNAFWIIIGVVGMARAGGLGH